ncbi:UNVERIFIED_CONTAM: hypothetical protein GTU68_010646 [Idotea baltica]|nr:hypothetical protein [Idotea baltica]
MSSTMTFRSNPKATYIASVARGGRVQLAWHSHSAQM